MLDHIFLSVSDVARSIRFYDSLEFVFKNWQHVQ